MDKKYYPNNRASHITNTPQNIYDKDGYKKEMTVALEKRIKVLEQELKLLNNKSNKK